MAIMGIVLIIAGIIAAIFWVIELSMGVRASKIIIRDINGNIFRGISAGPKIIMAFSAFILDVMVTMFCTTVFIISASIPGMAISLLMSDIISVWILYEFKENKEVAVELAN